MSIYLALCISAIAFILIMLFPNFAWILRYPFMFTNKLQWFLVHPFRGVMKDPRSKWPRRLFLGLMPLTFFYHIVIYIVLIPVRLINAIYFDIILFLSVTMRNGLMDLIVPSYPWRPIWRYICRWLLLLPWRLLRMIWKYASSIFQGIAMLAFDLVWHTLTLFHGTTAQVGGDVAHTSIWSAGSGNHVGTGIYFGLEERVARHYSRSAAKSRNGKPCVIMARVNLVLCRPAPTLPRKLRQAIGHDGNFISNNMGALWKSIEYWRRDMKWYEFCLTQKDKHRPTRIWRVRPICLLNKKHRPERVRWGLAFWPRAIMAWILLVIALSIISIAVAAYIWHPIWK